MLGPMTPQQIEREKLMQRVRERNRQADLQARADFHERLKTTGPTKHDIHMMELGGRLVSWALKSGIPPNYVSTWPREEHGGRSLRRKPPAEQSLDWTMALGTEGRTYQHLDADGNQLAPMEHSQALTMLFVHLREGTDQLRYTCSDSDWSECTGLAVARYEPYLVFDRVAALATQYQVSIDSF